MTQTITQIDEWIRGKTVLILGFGREGESTYRVLQASRSYKDLAVADLAERKENCPAEEITWICGPDYQRAMDDYDVVFKSPGIVLERPAKEYRCRILSQTEVFIRLFREQIIGVTGTKGKSTTASLLYHVLKSAGRKALLVGNIGIPAFDHLEEIEEDTEIIFELSCHQLEYLTVSPHLALLLNIHEEHLDHYGTMENYVRAKQQIYRHQQEADILICNYQCYPAKEDCCSRKIAVQAIQQNGTYVEKRFGEVAVADVKNWKKAGLRNKEKENKENQENIVLRESCIFWKDRQYAIPVEEIRLLGQHNYLDIAFVYAACKLRGVSDEQITQGLKTYTPLPHRLSFLGIKEGRKYYDDSISTICDTAIQALNTIKDADTVLIGGMDRGIDYRELIEYLSESPVLYIILMEATGKRIYQEIGQDYPGFQKPERLVPVEHLPEAVEAAKKLTRPGRSCILSPAAASYGIFTNFEERGDVFRELVFGAGDVYR